MAQDENVNMIHRDKKLRIVICTSDARKKVYDAMLGRGVK